MTISKFDPCPPRTYVAPPQTWAKAAEEAKKHAGFGLDKRVERAAKLLAMGQGFEMAHSVEEALDQYNKIVSAYPETEQAKTARERIRALSGYKK